MSRMLFDRLVDEDYNHFEIAETLASPYGLLGRAARRGTIACWAAPPGGVAPPAAVVPLTAMMPLTRDGG